MGDGVSGDADFGSQEGVGDAGGGVIGNDTAGEGDRRGIIVLSGQNLQTVGNAFGSMPAMTLRITAASLTVLAIGPIVS